MLAAIYARKSTDDSDRNAEARSTRRQIESATAYAGRKSWTVDERFIFVDENTSGPSGNSARASTHSSPRSIPARPSASRSSPNSPRSAAIPSGRRPLSIGSRRRPSTSATNFVRARWFR